MKIKNVEVFKDGTRKVTTDEGVFNMESPFADPEIRFNITNEFNQLVDAETAHEVRVLQEAFHDGVMTEKRRNVKQ